jgi:hypothetical protein
MMVDLISFLWGMVVGILLFGCAGAFVFRMVMEKRWRNPYAERLHRP